MVQRRNRIAQLYLMLQQLLADRFALKAHAEQKELPVYELTIGKAAPSSQKRPAIGIAPLLRRRKSLAIISPAVSDLA
jgi:uncharacterized protein (TIGR03435 family)